MIGDKKVSLSDTSFVNSRPDCCNSFYLVFLRWITFSTSRILSLMPYCSSQVLQCWKILKLMQWLKLHKRTDYWIQNYLHQTSICYLWDIITIHYATSAVHSLIFLDHPPSPTSSVKSQNHKPPYLWSKIPCSLCIKCIHCQSDTSYSSPLTSSSCSEPVHWSHDISKHTFSPSHFLNSFPYVPLPSMLSQIFG